MSEELLLDEPPEPDEFPELLPELPDEDELLPGELLLDDPELGLLELGLLEFVPLLLEPLE